MSGIEHLILKKRGSFRSHFLSHSGSVIRCNNCTVYHISPSPPPSSPLMSPQMLLQLLLPPKTPLPNPITPHTHTRPPPHPAIPPRLLRMRIHHMAPQPNQAPAFPAPRKLTVPEPFLRTLRVAGLPVHFPRLVRLGQRKARAGVVPLRPGQAGFEGVQREEGVCGCGAGFDGALGGGRAGEVEAAEGRGVRDGLGERLGA
jgi:hypothetical protein